MRAGQLYDRIGHDYTATRRADPRIAGAIWRALGDAQAVLNVGAGAGAYEPADRRVLAVEPSSTMIAQRPVTAAPAIQASAEQLPLPDDSFDAVMVVLSDHHWHDRLRGLRELRRVARRRVVLFNADPGEAERFWLTREYLPQFLELIPAKHRAPGAWQQELAHELGSVSVCTVPIPGDCRDGFYSAYWRRPHSYLDPAVRAGISVFAFLPAHSVRSAVVQLRHDLATGRWQDRHAGLMTLDELDLGYRVVVAELT